MDNKLIVIVVLLILFICYNSASNSGHNNPNNPHNTNKITYGFPENETVSKQINKHLKLDKKGYYIDNDVLTGDLPLSSAHYRTPNQKSITRYIHPRNHDKMRQVAEQILQKRKFEKDGRKRLETPKEFYERKSNCQDIATRRCKVPPINSTRCTLNECELSTYNQCTNNVVTQNTCECRANDLCKLPDKRRKYCYEGRLKECMAK